MIPHRQEVLESLVNMSAPLEEIRSQLREFSWDSDKELVTLTVERVKDVLGGYIQGLVPADIVQEWAEAIEGRDDIGFELSHKDAIVDVLHELANPALYGSLKTGSAAELLSRLTTITKSRTDRKG
jgi:hypothetical protein